MFAVERWILRWI